MEVSTAERKKGQIPEFRGTYSATEKDELAHATRSRQLSRQPVNLKHWHQLQMKRIQLITIAAPINHGLIDD